VAHSCAVGVLVVVIKFVGQVPRAPDNKLAGSLNSPPFVPPLLEREG